MLHGTAPAAILCKSAHTVLHACSPAARIAYYCILLHTVAYMHVAHSLLHAALQPELQWLYTCQALLLSLDFVNHAADHATPWMHCH